ncbi:hypothetical protein [Murimonas intestini]|uniref:hypothetical protein n=1 Tax=Murimonas intestini TaxID=1337051 RepID=UPI001FA9A264|nr:hypothetical protein [Murimonas intestini]
MKSHTSLVAQQTRLREWAELVRDHQLIKLILASRSMNILYVQKDVVLKCRKHGCLIQGLTQDTLQ